VPPERWKPSVGLKAVTMASWLVKVGLFCLMVRFFFPRVFLMPAVVIAGLVYVAECVARFRVLLDRAAGEVAITIGWWTKRVPLIRIERVNEVLRFGAEINLAGGVAFTYSPFRKRRTLARLLKIRSLAFGAGVFSLAVAVAVAVQPQAGGWLVHSVAVLLRIFYGAGGVVGLLVGAGILHSALRNRHTAPAGAAGPH
jgi:hypothetical protein